MEAVSACVLVYILYVKICEVRTESKMGDEIKRKKYSGR